MEMHNWTTRKSLVSLTSRIGLAIEVTELREEGDSTAVQKRRGGSRA
jgi:hypothetical protein